MINNHDWPDAVSDGLSIPCEDCGQIPRFDYRVTDEFWAKYGRTTGVVCLPCLDIRCNGEDLADALLEVQWTGTKHTVVLEPSFRHKY